MNMLKVVATLKKNGKVLVVLPYTSTGAYGSWELPRFATDSAKTVLNQAIGYDAGLTEIKSFTQAIPNGSVYKVVQAELNEVPSSFHCSIDMKNVELYGKMVFPAYVQMQFVSPIKACRLLKKSYAMAVREALNLPEEDEK